jgi:hypothetical protein
MLALYGIDLETYARLEYAQGRRCPGCLRALAASRVHIDHCHKTGAVRGLLCGTCNIGIGQLGDDPDTIGRLLLKYLRDAKPETISFFDLG